MSEPSPIILSSPDAGNRSAGEALKRVRESQGMTLEALASMIKVTPAKLEALEQGRYDLLPDANFTRALAMTVCRALRMDPGEILPGLPAARPAPLAEGKPPLNQPFKEAKGGAPLFDKHAFNWSALLNPRYLAPIILLIAAALIYALPDSILPRDWFSSSKSPGATTTVTTTSAAPVVTAQPAPANPVQAASAAVQVPSPAMAEPLRLDAVEAPAPPTPSAATAIAPASAIDPRLSAAQPSASLQAPGLTPSVALSSTGALNFTANASSWIEVKDASGTRLFSRLVKSGENISLNGSLPLQVRIGNVASVQMRFKGQPVDLSAYSRNNVARIELK